MAKSIKKKVFILTAGRQNSNHRTYPVSVVKQWVDDKRLLTDGIKIEYAVDDADFEYEGIQANRVCGNINTFKFDDNGNLYAEITFRPDSRYFEELKSLSSKNMIAIVPKGIGAVKHKIIQADYELYGFQLVMATESAFKRPMKPTKYEVLPGWRVLKAVGIPEYDIHKILKNDKGEIEYPYIGTLGCDGILIAKCLNGEKRFFGKNVKNAVRFLFLKTQKPL